MRRIIILLAALTLSGCARLSRDPTSLGRPVIAASSTVSQTDTGDPPPERNGTLSSRLSAQENEPEATSARNTPRAALRTYALVYGNWSARTLPARERHLAKLAIGPARLNAEQTEAARREQNELAGANVRNEAHVVAIAPEEGQARDQWVVVTSERTTGTRAYEGLPAQLQVALARLVKIGGGWVVCQWQPVG